MMIMIIGLRKENNDKMALIKHSKYIMFLSLCCLVLIIITIITLNNVNFCLGLSLCDQSLERQALVLPWWQPRGQLVFNIALRVE